MTLQTYKRSTVIFTLVTFKYTSFGLRYGSPNPNPPEMPTADISWQFQTVEGITAFPLKKCILGYCLKRKTWAKCEENTYICQGNIAISIFH